MTPSLRILARFCLEFVAMLLGFDQPEQEYALRGALAEPDAAHAADQIEALAKKQRKVYAEHKRLVEPALRLLRGERVDAGAARLLGATALHALRALPARSSWSADLQGGRRAEAVEDAYRASLRQDGAGVGRALGGALAGATPSMAALLSAIAEVYGGELVERLPSRGGGNSEPPPGLNLDRGRKSRAELVWAILRADEVVVHEVERGRPRHLSREELVEAILLDPIWDDIDASVQEDGVVDSVLSEFAPSPAISLRHRGLPDIYIRRISP